MIIPYSPRPQFQPLHERGKRWAVVVAHRRAGKTVACINELIKGALTCPLTEPRFAYAAPFYAQAKDVAWSYLKRFTAPLPGVSVNEGELRVDLPNGGRVRLYGLDNYDRLRGGYFDGIVLDEYGDADPRAWQEVIRPALSDRKGWAVFIGTPKGRNHFAELMYGDADGEWKGAINDAEWFTATLKASETGLLDKDELADARKTMTEDQYEAEYECSFQAAVIGSYFGREMNAAEKDKRVTRVPWEPKIPVDTGWDLGIGDSTAVWFCQRVGREVRLIDYLENSGVGIDWYAKALREKPYVYGNHYLPHDAEPKQLGSGKSIKETLHSLGIKALVNIVRRKEDSINASRLLLPQCWFDAEKTRRGIECLRNYRREFDEKLKAFKDRPLHDWTSHGSDAFAELAAGLKTAPKTEWKQPSTRWVV